MPTVSDILSMKGATIYSMGPDATVLEATSFMNQHRIGALMVMQDGRVVGMFTERDVLRRVVAEQRSPQQVRLRDVMTSDVVCVPPETDIEEASAVMRDRRIRHLPVCDSDGGLVGLISIGDLNAMFASSQEATIASLHEYIYGRV